MQYKHQIQNITQIPRLRGDLMHPDTWTAARTVMELIGSLRGYANGRKNIKIIKISVFKVFNVFIKQNPVSLYFMKHSTL